MTRSNQFVAAVVVIVLMLTGVMYSYYTQHRTTETVALLGSNETIPSTTIGDSSTTSAKIILADNEPGRRVLIEQVNIPVSGYVALYRINAAKEVDLIGESDLLTPGVSNSLIVETTSSLEAGQALVAVVFADDGDRMTTAGLPDRPLLNDGFIVTDIDIIGQDKTKETDSSLNTIQQQIDAKMK